MDKISDSGSEAVGSIPAGITFEGKLQIVVSPLPFTFIMKTNYL